MTRLKEDEKMTVALTDGQVSTHGGARHLTIVNEPGLYRLIFTSRKKEAEAFKTWVFTDVLPSIRKTGSYTAGNLIPFSPVSDLEGKMRAFDISNPDDVATYSAMANLLRDISTPLPAKRGTVSPALFKQALVTTDRFAHFLSEFFEKNSPDHHPLVFTVDQLIAAGAPVTAQDPRKACGQRLRRLIDHPFRPQGTVIPLIIRKRRVASLRSYIMRRPDLGDMAN